MKKAFTLIELIFVIVIIGVLASIAIPKFKNLTTHAKSSGVKSVVSSVQSSIDNIHGKWIVNDSMTSFKDPQGNSHNLNSNGYPYHLDDYTNDKNHLFKWVLKIPVPACGSGKTTGCWKEDPQDTYSYYYSSKDVLKLEYNDTTGVLGCVQGEGEYQNVSKCEEVVY